MSLRVVELPTLMTLIFLFVCQFFKKFILLPWLLLLLSYCASGHPYSVNHSLVASSFSNLYHTSFSFLWWKLALCFRYQTCRVSVLVAIPSFKLSKWDIWGLMDHSKTGKKHFEFLRQATNSNIYDLRIFDYLSYLMQLILNVFQLD